MTMPLELLEKSNGKGISVTLKDGRTISGKLAGHDDLMNLNLEDAVENTSETEGRRLGRLVLRGNNIVSISFA